jgi:hypothetical protein
LQDPCVDLNGNGIPDVYDPTLDLDHNHHPDALDPTRDLDGNGIPEGPLEVHPFFKKPIRGIL